MSRQWEVEILGKYEVVGGQGFLPSAKELLSAKDLVRMGFGRSMSYQLLNRSDLPVISIGGRLFMHRQLFEEWLKVQATKSKES